jgi:D-alanyl-D-alanine carboxypeptidase
MRRLRAGRNGVTGLRTPALLLGALLLSLAVSAAPAAADSRYASYVIEAETGRVLHAVNEDQPRYPASLTKMMTLYMVFDALDAGRLRLDTPLPVSARAAGQAPSKLGLPAGSSIAVRDAILALVTRSANDISVVLAEAIGGSETQFAQMMTQRARSIGMRDTTFRNASGLPNTGQRSTARDLAVLARSLIVDHRRHYHWFSRTEFEFRGTTYRSHNRLMQRFEGMDGLKTGFINASGFNLAASAVRDGRRLIGVVMGGQSARSRDDHMAELLERAFEKRPSGAPPAVAALPVPAAPALRRSEEPAAQARRAGFVPPLPAPKPAPSGGPTSIAALAAAVAGDGASAPLRPEAAVQVEQGDAAAGPEPTVGGWAIQVGSFSRRESSEAAASRARDRLGDVIAGAETTIMAVRTDGGETVFRARLTGLDEPTAREACTRLLRAGRGCFAVPPGTGS